MFILTFLSHHRHFTYLSLCIQDSDADHRLMWKRYQPWLTRSSAVMARTGIQELRFVLSTYLGPPTAVYLVEFVSMVLI
jgi:hypothetical protein